MTQNKNNINGKEAKERKKMVEMARKSNFHIGETALMQKGGYA